MSTTKEDAQNALDALSEMFNAIPKSKRPDYLGHLNEISLLLEAVQREAPAETPAEEAKQG